MHSIERTSVIAPSNARRVESTCRSATGPPPLLLLSLLVLLATTPALGQSRVFDLASMTNPNELAEETTAIKLDDFITYRVSNNDSDRQQSSPGNWTPLNQRITGIGPSVPGGASEPLELKTRLRNSAPEAMTAVLQISPLLAMAGLRVQLSDSASGSVEKIRSRNWDPNHGYWKITLQGNARADLQIQYTPAFRSAPMLTTGPDQTSIQNTTASRKQAQQLAGVVFGLIIASLLAAALFGQRSLIWLACYIFFLELSQPTVFAAIQPSVQPDTQQWLVFSNLCATLALVFFFFANYQLVRSLLSNPGAVKFPDTLVGGLGLARAEHGKLMLAAFATSSVVVPGAIIALNSALQYALPLYLFFVSVLLSLYLAFKFDAFAEGHSLLIYVATLRFVEGVLFTGAALWHTNGYINIDDLYLATQLLITSEAMLLLLLLLVAMNIQQKQSLSGAYATGRREMRIAAIAPLLNRSKHDLRSPITDIVGLSELVLDAPLNRDQRLNVLEIQKLARKALSRTNQLFSYRQGESQDGEDRSHETFSIENVLLECTQYFLPRGSSDNTDIVVAVAPDLPNEWHGDHGSLRQLLLHVIEFMLPLSPCQPLVLDALPGKQGELLVQTQCEASAEQLRSHTLRHGEIFNIARGLAAQSQGYLDLVAGNEVVTCSLSLPLTEIQAGRFLERYDGLLRGMSVLFVDDNPTVCKVYTEFASQWEMKTFSASDSQSTLELIAQQQRSGAPIDFMFIDYFLDETDGIELTRQIKLDAGSDKCTIYLISNAVDDINAVTAKNCGVRKVLEKPLLPMAMKTLLVEELIARKSIAEGVQARSSQETAVQNAQTRILLVEDNPISVRIVRAMLGKFSLDCDVASNSQQAMSLFETNEYELVLLDCELPDRNGFQTAEMMRSVESTRGSESLIAALTAHDDQKTIDKCRESGMNKHLSKPIDLYQLESIIQRARQLQVDQVQPH